ncbi:SusD family protein [compost metagenome]
MVFKGTHSSSINALFTGLSTAELFLISAESKIRNGDMVGGAADLNKLLKSRWNKKMPFREKVITHTASGLDEVLLERRKELLYRGLRWSDIKRLNLEGRNIVLKRIAEGELVTLNPNSPMYQLPLPKDLEAYLK